MVAKKCFSAVAGIRFNVEESALVGRSKFRREIKTKFKKKYRVSQKKVANFFFELAFSNFGKKKFHLF